MKKIVINVCFGGFTLSNEAVKRYAELKGIDLTLTEDKKYADLKYWSYFNTGKYFDICDIDRDDPILVQVVEELGYKNASGDYSQLKIVEIPDYIDWVIDSYDGNEQVREKSGSWR